MILVAAGKVDHDQLVALAEQHLRATCPRASAPGHAPARFTGGARHGRQPSEQAHLTFAFPAPSDAAPGLLCRAPVRRRGRRRHVVAAVPAGARGSRAGLFGQLDACTPLPTPACSTSTPRRRRGQAAAALAADRGDRRRGRRRRHPARARPGADAGAGGTADVARDAVGPGRLSSPASWPCTAAWSTRPRSSTRLLAVTLDDVRAAGARMIAGPVARATIGCRWPARHERVDRRSSPSPGTTGA